jgi:nucleoside-triphosphatase
MTQKTNVLVTGRPGSGKTTLLQKVCRELADFRPAGFVTVEMREGGKRTGFELAALDGTRFTLAHAAITGQGRVGRYGVDVHGFEAFLEGLALESPEAGFAAIDEIGKMECLSPKFVRLAERVLDSGKPLLATVAAKGTGFIAEVKARSDVELVSVTEQNRDGLAAELVRRMQALLG